MYKIVCGGQSAITVTVIMILLHSLSPSVKTPQAMSVAPMRGGHEIRVLILNQCQIEDV